MESFSVQAYLKATDNNFVSTFKEAAKQVKTFQKDTNSTMAAVGQVTASTGKTLTKTVTAPIVGLGVVATKVGGDFEAQMSRVKAISGATGSAFDELRQQAIDLGAKTAFSAKESAAGMENLASAGFDANEIMQAMPGLLDLAAVSGGDVALASENAATALRGFNLDASEAGHVADVFAEAAADTNAEVGDMGYAMKYIAPVANSMGLSLEEVAAAIGIMSDAGIKGTQAGTTLRGALSRLAKPTKPMIGVMNQLGLSFYDASGKMKPLKDQIEMLQKAFKDLTPEQQQNALVTLYGQESLSGMMALIDKGPEKLGSLTKSLENSDGAADKMARTMQDNMNSSLEQMMGAFESAAIVVQKILAPAIRQVADLISDLVQKFVSAPEPIQRLIVVIGLIVTAIGPLLLVIGKSIKIFQTMKIGLMAIQAGLSLTGTAISGLLLPITAVIAVVVALAAAFLYFYNTNEEFRNKINQVWESILGFIQPIVETISNFIKEVFGMLLTWWNENQNSILSIVSTVWGVIKGIFEVAMIAIQAIVSLVLGQLQSAWEIWSNTISAIVQVAWAIISNTFKGTLANILSIVTAVINQIKLIIDTVMKVIENIFKIILSAIKGDWSGVLDGIKGIVGAFGDYLTDTFDNIMGLAKDLIKNGVDTIKGIFDSLSKINLLDIGKAIIDGFVKGLKSAWEAGKEFISGIGDWIREHKGPIRKDKKLLTPAGNAIMEGLNKGLFSGFKSVQSNVSSMGDRIGEVLGSDYSMDIGANVAAANRSIGGTVTHEVNMNNGKQPAYVTVRIGNQQFKAFVEDISNAQGQAVSLNGGF